MCSERVIDWLGRRHLPTARALLVFSFLLCWGTLSPAHAASAKNGDSQKAEVDSEDIFGFTSGTDLPDLGQKAAEIEGVGRFGKQDGSYAALTKSLAFKSCSRASGIGT